MTEFDKYLKITFESICMKIFHRDLFKCKMYCQKKVYTKRVPTFQSTCFLTKKVTRTFVSWLKTHSDLRSVNLENDLWLLNNNEGQQNTN